MKNLWRDFLTPQKGVIWDTAVPPYQHEVNTSAHRSVVLKDAEGVQLAVPPYQHEGAMSAVLKDAEGVQLAGLRTSKKITRPRTAPRCLRHAVPSLAHRSP